MASSGSAVRLRRLTNELKSASAGAKEDGVAIQVASDGKDTLSHFIGTITGPEDTPFENIKYEVDIHVGEHYPVEPPKMKFITVPYHPNVSLRGTICVTFLKSMGSAGWSPAMSIRSALVALRSLLDDPCPDDALNCEAAKDWRVAARTNNWQAYQRKVIERARNLV